MKLFWGIIKAFPSFGLKGRDCRLQFTTYGTSFEITVDQDGFIHLAFTSTCASVDKVP